MEAKRDRGERKDGADGRQDQDRADGRQEGRPPERGRTPERGARRRATGRRCPATPAGRRPATAPTRSGCWRSRTVTREPDLVPVRHGRMLVSPFTFYRGAAKIMAADLDATPTAGLQVQLCGDAHLSNFGVFASPERRLLFDLNDFDETLPGPFEYDVKRMAASFTIAGRNNGFAKADTRAATLGVGAGLPGGDGQLRRRWARWTSGTPTWTRTSSCRGSAAPPRPPSPRRARRRPSGPRRRPQKAAAKARTRDSLQALSKLGERGRRPVPDRQPAADRGPGAGPGGHLRPVGRRGRARPP